MNGRLAATCASLALWSCSSAPLSRELSSNDGPVTTQSGGKVDRFFFAVVGDSRPGRIDDTAAYPTDIVGGIYGALAKLNPKPQFVVTTGDYMFASTSGSEAAPQLDLYLQAYSQLGVPLWPAMGNHECTGATASNCGPEAGLETPNYKAFVQKMLQPIGESLPYFTRRVDASDGSWSAKFVVVAPNAWGPQQRAWFDAELAKPTTYTFVIHHEPSRTTEAPGVSDINDIVKKYPVTLSIVGHTHTWEQQEHEVIIGNGGAPLTGQWGGVTYGYTLFQQRSDGAIDISACDYTNGHPFQSFSLKADGSSAP